MPRYFSQIFKQTICFDRTGRSGTRFTQPRKTMIQTLRNSGFKTESIMEKSGHKNMSSVLNYSVITDDEQKKMTEALMGNRPQCSEGQQKQDTGAGPVITYHGCTFITPMVAPPTIPSIPQSLEELFDMFPDVF